MGAWGHESCSNDHCRNNIWADNIHEMTQEEADNSVDKCFATKTFDDTDDKETGIGVIIWILRQGLMVKKEYLNRVTEFAIDLIEDKDYLSQWESKTKRKQNLDRELAEINEALKKDGQGVKQHVPGLFEKIAIASIGLI